MKKLLTLITLSLFGSLATLQAQQTLADLVAEVGGEWLVGDWVGYSDNGDELVQTIHWDLDKHVIAIHFKTPRFEIKSMTAVDPTSGNVKYIGFSNRGGALTGTWQEESGWPLLRVKAVNQDGQTWKGALLFQRVDDNTMKIEIFRVDEDGELIYPARTSTEFKRKKKA